MTLDTENTVYICTDATNGELYILTPRTYLLTAGNGKLNIEVLKLDDPDAYGPHGTDRAQFSLLREEMDERREDL